MMQPALAVTAAPSVVPRARHEGSSAAPSFAAAAPPTAPGGHRILPTPGEHGALNVQTLLDGVHGRLEELRQNGQAALHLELSPPELGHVRMQLVAHEQQVDVHLVVQNDTARHVLAAQADTLRERLGTLGVALGRFDVRRDGGSPTQHEQPAPEPSLGSRRTTARPAPVRVSAGIDVIA
jgi:hypothetical protein